MDTRALRSARRYLWPALALVLFVAGIALARVLFLAGIEGAPLRYRVHHAMEQLRLQGVECTLRHYADPRAEGDADRSDAIVVYRSPATRELVSLLRRAHRRGIPTVCDLDDLIFDPELSEALGVVQALPLAERTLYLDGVHRYRATLEECGMATGSTPEIVRRMAALGIPAHEHPNGVGTALAVASELARRSRPGRGSSPARWCATTSSPLQSSSGPSTTAETRCWVGRCCSRAGSTVCGSTWASGSRRSPTRFAPAKARRVALRRPGRVTCPLMRDACTGMWRTRLRRSPA